MNELLVRDILDRIDQLSEDDRLVLERRIMERNVAELRYPAAGTES